ncbi:MAG: hypothetical protein M3285_08910 [Actinomycetota bacterium]|nr:hypothetical protein [Actinomycetota bacterium]
MAVRLWCKSLPGGGNRTEDVPVGGLKVALVSRDSRERLAVARAFDTAPASWDVSIHADPPPEADVLVLGSDVAEHQQHDGAVLFDPHNPALALDRVTEISATRLSRRYLVTGAGRGVGVTSCALHLAAAFAVRADTCLLDLDSEWGLETWIGFDSTSVKPPDRLPLAAHPVRGGFRVVAARHCDQDQASLQDECAGRFDRLVIDKPSPLGIDDRLGVAGAALVMSPAPTSIARARSVVEQHPQIPWAVVLNRLGPGGETTRAQIERSLGSRIAVELPCTPCLRDAEERGRLLSSCWFRYVRRIDALSRALERT